MRHETICFGGLKYHVDIIFYKGWMISSSLGLKCRKKNGKFYGYLKFKNKVYFIYQGLELK